MSNHYSHDLHKINSIIQTAFKPLQNYTVTNNLFQSVPQIVLKTLTVKDNLVNPKVPSGPKFNPKTEWQPSLK